jgi:hypothetical protein
MPVKLQLGGWGIVMLIRTVGAILALSMYAAPALASEFLAYDGKDAIHDGRGGERKTVDGVDFWMTGDPPHRYQVLGSIVDRRHQSGLIGLARMAALDHDIAKQTKAAGGDAVILEGEGTDVIGASSSTTTQVGGHVGGGSFGGWGNSFGVATTIRKHDSRWMVVRYLPDAPSAPTQAGSP